MNCIFCDVRFVPIELGGVVFSEREIPVVIRDVLGHHARQLHIPGD